MDYVIGILSERLTRLENAWTEFVTSGKVSEDSPTAKQKAKEMNEIRTAIKILTTDVETGKYNCNLHVVTNRTFPKQRRYRCLLCGRDKFTRRSPHNCKGGFRKRNIKWQQILE